MPVTAVYFKVNHYDNHPNVYILKYLSNNLRTEQSTHPLTPSEGYSTKPPKEV